MPVEPASLRSALVDLLLGDAATAATAAAVVRELGAQDDLLHLAWVWRIVPRLHERVAAGASLGNAADARLAELAVAAAAQSTLYLHRAGAALATLEAAGVPAGVFKGIGSIGALYRTPAARMVSDVDVVIDPVDVEKAVAALRCIGFEPTASIDSEGITSWIDKLRSPMVHLRNLFVSLRNDEGFEVDLHLRFGYAPPPRMTPASLLSRRTSTSVASVTLPVLAPVDLILLNVYHSLKDLLALTSAARDLADLASWWERGGALWSLDELVDASIASRLDVPLLAFWLVLAHADQHGPVTEGVARLDAAVGPGTRRDARRMVRLVEQLVDEGRISRGLLSTLSPDRVRRYRAQRRRRADARANGRPIDSADRIAGLRRIGREAFGPRRLAAYRALARAQRGFR
jgi:hypothetical protein